MPKYRVKVTLVTNWSFTVERSASTDAGQFAAKLAEHGVSRPVGDEGVEFYPPHRIHSVEVTPSD